MSDTTHPTLLSSSMLEDLQKYVDEGKSILITGLSNTGKSTLLNVLKKNDAFDMAIEDIETPREATVVMDSLGKGDRVTAAIHGVNAGAGLEKLAILIADENTPISEAVARVSNSFDIVVSVEMREDYRYVSGVYNIVGINENPYQLLGFSLEPIWEASVTLPIFYKKYVS